MGEAEPDPIWRHRRVLRFVKHLLGIGLDLVNNLLRQVLSLVFSRGKQG